MADLGTLWFGADIDLSRLQQKIQQGNQGILDALKMNYDPQSYQQMVDKLRTELGKETFELKLTANTQNIVNSVRGATSGRLGFGSLAGLDELTEKIYRQQGVVNALIATVERLKIVWQKNGGSANRDALLDAKGELVNAKRELADLINQRKAYNEAIRQTAKEHRDASQAAKQMERDQVRLNMAFGDGVHISTRLGSALSSLYSIHAARQFLSNVIEIGGQLEKQRISMGAIIGDTARANELFGQIKQLAIQSPFGVVELDQYSKQLAAFGIEQNELFDMTKRLADISAGAGQDIGRLALALGHVKSATYLTGITLRQFSMNNIPMLKMLADYYTEVEKRAVSTAEVQKRISKRQVSYEDVVEQIKRMTDAGGQFYNMQEKISESLQAKYKNLRDSFDIMYGEIAESGLGDVLKDFAEGATNMARNWRGVMTTLGVAATVFGSLKLSAVAVNTAITAQTKSLGKLGMVSKSMSAQQINNLAVQKLITRENLLNAVASKRLTVEQAKLAGSTLGLTEAQLKQVVGHRKLAAGLAANAIATSRYNVAQLRTLAGMRSLNLTFWAFGHRIKFLDRALISATAIVKGFGTALTALGRSIMVAAKPLAMFLIISEVVSLWQRHNQEVERAKELNDDLFNRMTEGLKNVQKMMETTGMKMTFLGQEIGLGNTIKFGSKIEFPDAKDIDDMTMRKSIETWTQFIKEYSPVPNLMLQAAYATDKNGKSVLSLAEQYDELGKKANIVVFSMQMLGTLGDALSNAIVESKSGWFDNDLLTDMKDYENAFKAQRKVINQYVNQYKKATEVALENAKKSKVFTEALKESGIEAENVSGQLQFLVNNQDKYTDAVERFEKGFQSVANIGLKGLFDVKKVNEAGEELDAEMHQVAEKMRETLGGTFDLSKMTPEKVEAFGVGLTRVFADAATKAGLSVDEVTKKVMELAQKEFPQIKLDIDEVKTVATISAIEEQLNKLVGGDFHIDIKTATDAFDVIQKIREAYKTAKDQIENAEPILMSLKLSTEAVSLMTDEQIEQAANGDEFVKQVLMGVKNAQQKINDAITASDKYNFSLTDPTKGGKVFRDKEAKKKKKETDERIKQWREELKELENFYRIYKRNSEYMSKNDAIQKALETGVFSDKSKLPKDIDDYLTVLRDFRDKVQKEMGKNPSEERKGFLSDLLTKIDEKEFEQKTKQVADKALKDMQEYISKESEKFNLYKTILEKTGSKGLAELAFTDGRIFDDATRKFEQRLKEVAGGIDIDYSMSDSDAKEFFAGNKQAYELWKKLVEMTSKNYVDALNKAANAQERILTNEQKIEILNKKILDAQNDTSGIDHSAEIQQWREEISKLKSEMFEFTDIYEKIFGEKLYKGFNALKSAENAARELIGNAKAGPTNPKTGKVSYYSSFYMDGNEVKLVTLTREQLERLKRTIDEFHRDEVKKNPFRTLISDVKELYKQLSDGESNPEKAQEAWSKFAESLAESAKIVGDLAGQLSAMFDSLGNESMADAMDDLQAGMNSVSNIANGFANGGVVGGIVAAAGEAIGWIGRLAQKHDKKLDKAIQKSQQEVKKLANAYKNLEGAIDRALGGIYTTGGYRELFANLKKQRAELASQADNERRKKKKDEDKITDYQQQMKELDDQIKYFAEDLAKSLYDIDVHSWAQELGDSLFEAWQKGENGAEAFKKKAQEIIAEVAKSIAVQKLIEKAMEPVLDVVTNEMDRTSGMLDERSIEAIANAMSVVGNTLPNAFTNLMDGLDAGLQKAGFGSMKDAAESDNTLSSGIKGVTEETADILASYINAIRADVSMNRMIVSESLPAITVAVERTNVIAEQQVAYQEQIALNTRQNADAAEAIYDLLHRVELGGASLKVK